MGRSFLSLIILSGLLLLGTVSCKEKAETENINNTSEERFSAIKEGPLSSEERNHYKTLGKSMAEATFEVMSSNLRESLLRGGVEEAVSYCNVVALKLTDSLSVVHDATIKRTSLKLRNPENKASEDEFDVLNRYKSSLDNNLEINPMVSRFGKDSVKFYAPIYTKELCLNCHGVPGKTLQTKDLKLIKELYPEDLAIDYGVGEFRGIWSIAMLRNWIDPETK